LTATLRAVANRPKISCRDIEALIVPCAGLKAEIVSEDERDLGMRQWLNYGHTFAHAIEQTLKYRRLAHGEAVIVGMIGALALGRELKIGEPKSLAPFEQLVMSARQLLPRLQLDADKVCSAMDLDKKRSTGGINFILLKRPGRPVIVSNVPVSNVRRAVQAMITNIGEA